MSDTILPVPLPRYDGPFQPGVTDPVWDAAPPPGTDQEKYESRYAGQLERQRYLHVITADVSATTRQELNALLTKLTGFAQHQMLKEPPGQHRRPYDVPIKSQRVTVTIGFGATLFTTKQGDDRFTIAGKKPTWFEDHASNGRR